MTDVPRKMYRFNGLAINTPPMHLRSYVDCVDGAVLLGSYVLHDRMGAAIWMERWTLHRGEKIVGELNIERPPQDGLVIRYY